MEPVLRSHFIKFKRDFEIDTRDDPKKEATAFERFVNYVLFSLDYPDAFTADMDLLEFTSVGGSDDTFIDGIGIIINDRLIRSIGEINEIADSSRKLSIEFMFVQSKMRASFALSELSNFGVGVKHFFSEPTLPENSKISEFRQIKDYIYSNPRVISKLQKNPSIHLYFVGTGAVPDNEHFSATKTLITNDITKSTECYFEDVEFSIIGGKQLERVNTKYIVAV